MTATDRAMLASALGAAIQGRRLAARLTREQLAERLGLDPTTIARWEDGRRLPSLSRLGTIALALGCSTLDLVAATQPRSPSPLPDRHQFEAALAELLESAAQLVNGLGWSPQALPLAERLSAAVSRLETLSMGGTE